MIREEAWDRALDEMSASAAARARAGWRGLAYVLRLDRDARDATYNHHHRTSMTNTALSKPTSSQSFTRPYDSDEDEPYLAMRETEMEWEVLLGARSPDESWVREALRNPTRRGVSHVVGGGGDVDGRELSHPRVPTRDTTAQSERQQSFWSRPGDEYHRERGHAIDGDDAESCSHSSSSISHICMQRFALHLGTVGDVTRPPWSPSDPLLGTSLPRLGITSGSRNRITFADEYAGGTLDQNHRFVCRQPRLVENLARLMGSEACRRLLEARSGVAMSRSRLAPHVFWDQLEASYGDDPHLPAGGPSYDGPWLDLDHPVMAPSDAVVVLTRPPSPPGAGIDLRPSVPQESSNLDNVQGEGGTGSTSARARASPNHPPSRAGDTRTTTMSTSPPPLDRSRGMTPTDTEDDDEQAEVEREIFGREDNDHDHDHDHSSISSFGDHGELPGPAFVASTMSTTMMTSSMTTEEGELRRSWAPRVEDDPSPSHPGHDPPRVWEVLTRSTVDASLPTLFRHVEVVFFLGCLSAGVRKRSIQRRLCAVGMTQHLCWIMNEIPWLFIIHKVNPYAVGIAAVVQVLRMALHYADRAPMEVKMSFLSDEEHALLTVDEARHATYLHLDEEGEIKERAAEMLMNEETDDVDHDRDNEEEEEGDAVEVNAVDNSQGKATSTTTTASITGCKINPTRVEATLPTSTSSNTTCTLDHHVPRGALSSLLAWTGEGVGLGMESGGRVLIGATHLAGSIMRLSLALVRAVATKSSPSSPSSPAPLEDVGGSVDLDGEPEAAEVVLETRGLTSSSMREISTRPPREARMINESDKEEEKGREEEKKKEEKALTIEGRCHDDESIYLPVTGTATWVSHPLEGESRHSSISKDDDAEVDVPGRAFDLDQKSTNAPKVNRQDEDQDNSCPSTSLTLDPACCADPAWGATGPAVVAYLRRLARDVDLARGVANQGDRGRCPRRLSAPSPAATVASCPYRGLCVVLGPHMLPAAPDVMMGSTTRSGSSATPWAAGVTPGLARLVAQAICGFQGPSSNSSRWLLSSIAEAMLRGSHPRLQALMMRVSLPAYLATELARHAALEQSYDATLRRRWCEVWRSPGWRGGEPEVSAWLLPRTPNRSGDNVVSSGAGDGEPAEISIQASNPSPRPRPNPNPTPSSSTTTSSTSSSPPTSSSAGEIRGLPSSISQMHYDLLAETIKFNLRSIDVVEVALLQAGGCAPAPQPDMPRLLARELVEKMVDSNVVLRSLLLTTEHLCQAIYLQRALDQHAVRARTRDGREETDRGRQDREERLVVRRVVDNVEVPLDQLPPGCRLVPSPAPGVLIRSPCLLVYVEGISIYHEAVTRRVMGQRLGTLGVLLEPLATLLRRLVESVAPHRITQDNVCVINTSLLVMVLADRAGDLKGCLREALISRRLGEEDGRDRGEGARDRKPGEEMSLPSPSSPLPGLGSSQPSPADRVRALRAFLRFWKRYYVTRRGDADSMTWSSGLPFVVWRSTVRRAEGQLSKLEEEIEVEIETMDGGDRDRIEIHS